MEVAFQCSAAVAQHSTPCAESLLQPVGRLLALLADHASEPHAAAALRRLGRFGGPAAVLTLLTRVARADDTHAADVARLCAALVETHLAGRGGEDDLSLRSFTLGAMRLLGQLGAASTLVVARRSLGSVMSPQRSVAIAPLLLHYAERAANDGGDDDVACAALAALAWLLRAAPLQGRLLLARSSLRAERAPPPSVTRACLVQCSGKTFRKKKSGESLRPLPRPSPPA
eukprot:SAG11_NODE_3933_length_2143_cov_2.172211_2_plen_229_part_00